MRAAAALLVVAVACNGAASDPDPATCGQLADRWSAALQAVDRSCQVDGDCVLVGGIAACDGAAEVTGCAGYAVNRIAFQQDRAAETATTDWDASGCVAETTCYDIAFYPQCNQGRCEAAAIWCLPGPEVDAGPDGGP